MVDTAQVTYEHTAGNTLSFFTNDLKIKINRLFMDITARPDGVLKVTDPTVIQREFSCSAIMSADNYKILYDWYVAAITYTGDYPRLSAVYLDGDTILTNIEVAIVGLEASMVAANTWRVAVAFKEKSA
jgi:hypothetical protein